MSGERAPLGLRKIARCRRSLICPFRMKSRQGRNSRRSVRPIRHPIRRGGVSRPATLCQETNFRFGTLSKEEELKELPSKCSDRVRPGSGEIRQTRPANNLHGHRLRNPLGLNDQAVQIKKFHGGWTVTGPSAPAVNVYGRGCRSYRCLVESWVGLFDDPEGLFFHRAVREVVRGNRPRDDERGEVRAIGR